MAESRFIVGIDLGTTNCALAYLDTGADARGRHLPVPQVVRAGMVEARPLLPSFLYTPGPLEQPEGALALPWQPAAADAVGGFARDFGAQVPSRLVSSAKSWLSYAGVDRRGGILPWKAPPEAARVSPVEASARYLKHLAAAWNHGMAGDVADHRLEAQDVVLTVPASFDAVARELTVEAARAAGLNQLTLLEEPQAAFYAWLDALGDGWRDRVRPGERVLVADVGGGTTDFSLIEVVDENGQLGLSRVAVGDHLLLGGDNMDLALAVASAKLLTGGSGKLDPSQWQRLAHSARQAKEQLFERPDLASAPVTLLGRGSRVIGGTQKIDLPRAVLEGTVLDGFFPACDLSASPQAARLGGLMELGLPYASDPAITRHLAAFLTRHAGGVFPRAVLFNGGVFKAAVLRQRLLQVMSGWGGDVRELAGGDPDLAVARGAAYYGYVRRGRGIRIRGGTARSYYVGIELSAPAVPGFPPPVKALCVAPFGMEEGSEATLSAQEFGLVVGAEAEFRFLGSATRKNDAPGTVVEDWEADIEELAPLRTTLEGEPHERGTVIPVHLQSKVTEVGELELWCHDRDETRRWKLAYDVRER